MQLFDRDVRPMALTPSGTILLDKARSLLLSAREAIQAARQPTAATLPKLNICFVETIAGTIGLELVSKIQGFATQWSVQAGLPSHHSRALMIREADIVISSDPLEDGSAEGVGRKGRRSGKADKHEGACAAQHQNDAWPADRAPLKANACRNNKPG